MERLGEALDGLRLRIVRGQAVGAPCRAAGDSSAIASMIPWLSPPTVCSAGAKARVSNSRLDPDRGVLTIKSGGRTGP